MKRMILDLSKIKPLSEASHDKGINGRKVTKKNPSEWVWSLAVSKFPRKRGFTIKEFKEALFEAIAYEAMSKMIELDQAYMTIDNENNIVIGLYE